MGPGRWSLTRCRIAEDDGEIAGEMSRPAWRRCKERYGGSWTPRHAAADGGYVDVVPPFPASPFLVRFIVTFAGPWRSVLMTRCHSFKLPAEERRLRGDARVVHRTSTLSKI